jgi:tetratricopeptide (TPR) repeat protein
MVGMPNVKIRPKALPNMLALAASAWLLPMPAAAQAVHPAEAYTECAEKSQHMPEAALKIADGILRNSPKESAALHCKAMALYALRQYESAATILDDLARLMTASNPMLALDLWSQAAKAWQQAANLEKLQRASTEAIRLAEITGTTGRLPLLLSLRVDAKTRLGQHHAAIQDLDHLVSLEPQNPAWRFQRATVLDILGQAPLAQKDRAAGAALQVKKP